MDGKQRLFKNCPIIFLLMYLRANDFFLSKWQAFKTQKKTKQKRKTVIKLVHNNVIKNVISFFHENICISNKRDSTPEKH